jgi:broad specificity phosphatase PhoE
MTDATVYLARHGAHDWLHPEHGRLAGTLPGIGLNAKGRAEVAQMAARLVGEPVAWIAASPLQRTMETAQILAVDLSLPVAADDRLLEWRFGTWEGMSIAEIQRQYPSEWQTWRDRPDQLRLPGAETLDKVAVRMDAAFRAWAARGGVGVLVSHQDPLAALLCRLIGAPLNAMRAFEITTGSLSIVQEMSYGPVVTAINLGALLA